MTTLSQKNVNRSISKKKSDHFSVSFLRIDNPKNILGRQVKSIERPSITFGQFESYGKGGRQAHTTRQVTINDISITLFDDQWSLCTKALYNQIEKQYSEPVTFDIKVDVYGINDEIVESFTCLGCSIISISHSEQIYSQSTNNEIILVCNVVDVKYNFD